ncbi:BIRC6 isoform 2 [Pongo abelii]|uniref:BIRC6 isoform 2 n=1 Tax=Pongo abelii TaxID=9601 RepID=A0A2J8VNK5_PONAB|nr:BIRC6 isoform 2 [Pongo abelii]
MAAAAAAASGPGCSSAAGAGAAGVSEWLVLRDGCMHCDADGLHSLSYHPALNAILAVTSRGTIKVIDGTSGATLQASALSAKPGGQVKCQYISAVDKVIFVDDYAVGCRKDLNGILLLDTALQTPVSKQDDVVQLELPVTEAQQLLSACSEKVDISSTEGYDLFITQLKDGLKNTSHETAANHKVAKWATVTFHLPHHVLKSIASAIVNELKKINQNVAALPVASSVMDRLSYLLPSARPELGVGPGRSVDSDDLLEDSDSEEHSRSDSVTGGELHFLQIGGTCDDIDEADILVDGSLSKGIEPSSEGSKPLSNPSSPGISETAVDRQITFPLSPALNIEVEQNGKPSLVDLNEEMQHMDVEESQCMAGGKYRSFLIHVKAVNERGTEEICNGGMRPVEKSSNVKNENTSGTRKSENLRGCDLLQEVSVTIRRFKKTSISKERYGLYSSPFDPVLFDLEMSGSSCKNVYNSSIGVQSDEIDLSDVLSGARRFVTLDFGRPILLTDVLIPTCGDLASLSIDIWTLGEEVDGRRLVVATDISTHSLILHDLIPPPVCRFMKITVIGRYGSTNARAKIPLGFYYGHTYILPWESELKLMHDPLKGEGESANQPEIDQHLAMMVALQEDIQCRYNLACHRLETLLQSIDLPPLNSANNAQYFLRKPDKAVEEDSRVFSAYQDCIQLQLQLNLAHNAVQRLKVALGASRKMLSETSNPEDLIQTSSTEQLRTIIRYLLDTLLSLLHASNGHSVPAVLQSTFHAQACEELFKHLCISGTPKIRLHTGLLLVQLCGGERWWGQFLSNVLQELYNSEQLLIFPQDRVFMLLSCIGQRSLSNSGVLESLLNLLDNLLSPLQPQLPMHRRTEGVLDIPMISWVVMLVSRLLDYVATVEDEAAAAKKPLNGNQWSFINNNLHTQSLNRSSKGSSSLDRLYSRKIRKQLVHHKQQLNLLKAKQKALVEQMEKEKIQRELLAPVAAEAMEEGTVGDDVGATAGDSDDSLQQSSVQLLETIDEPLTHDVTGAPPLSSLEKDKEIDLELLQDLMEVDIDPLDIDLEKDPLAAKVFKPISSTWYDYWGADYGTYNYNPYIGGLGIPVAKPPANTEKNGSQTVSVSVSQALDARLEVGLEQQAELMLKMMSTLEADSILQALTNTSPTYLNKINETRNKGAFQTGQGPLDAQVKLLEFTLEQNFEVVSVSTISAVIESVTFLVHHYITCSDKVMSRSGSDSSVGARACFGGLFANLIRPGDAKAVCGEMTRDQLMFDLLKLVNILVQLPLSGNREYSARVSVTTNTTDSVSDEEKVSGGKDGNGSSTSVQGSPAYVADLVLANQQIMSQILSALGLCNSSAMAMIIGASGLHLTKHENFHGGLDAISVGDGLFTILTTLSKKASTVHMMLQPILTYMACGYMGRQGSLATCQLSEPLLWFILRVLDTSDALKAFHDMGGVQLICNNMVTSTRAIVNTARSMVSTIMKFLDSGPNKAVDSTLKTRILASEPDNAEGIHNFAPLGTITSSSPTAQPAEVLLQSTPPHRRARSAAWSYIFLPEEAWCDLTIHLPAAVLLKEIHIQPHLASLATCPSSVSVEVSADGVNMLPLSTPVVTSGLTYIKIQLVKAEVASAVCLRLHRPRDASTLGLSQIKLLGLTAFGTTSSATVNNPFLPSEDQVSKTSIGWLRLLHHCLTHISDLEGMMASAAAPTANLLQTCAALLMSPYCGMHSPNIEVVLVKIGLQSTRIGLKLIDILLRNCAASGSDPTDLNSPLLFGRLNGLSSDSTIDILYQLGTTQDPGTKDRIQALLKWVSDSARVAAMKRSGRMNYMCPNSSTIEYGLLMPSPSHLHCVAAILWHSYELLVEYDLPALLDQELFELLFNWSMSLPCNMVLKKAVDSLLCSMCHVHPNYFSLLMGWMGITPPPVQCHHRLSMTDDSKKQDLSSSLTDDSKNAQAPLALTESHLATLASSSQSPEAIKQLLDSGLPSLLVRSLASFCFSHISNSESIAQSIDISQDKLRRHHVPQQCNKMPITADLVAPILRFLTEVGSSHIMKDWLGGSEVNPLWTALLFLLCHSGSTSGSHNLGAQQTSARSASLSSAATTGLTTQQRTAIENATVAFFLQCISCHPNNQKLMAQVLCELFQTSPQRGNLPTSGNISGFIRRLFLQLMLEDEKVTMFLQSPCPLYKGRINATSHVIQHPMYGAGHKFRTLHLPVSTTLSDVLDRVSDTPSITAKLISEQKDDKEKKNHEEKEKVKAENGFQDNYSVVVASGLKSQSKRAVSATPPRPPSRRGRTIPDKIGSTSGAEAANKIITVPVFHLFHKLLAGQPLPAEMTLAQLLTLLYDRKLPQGYRSIDLTVKLGSRVITDPSLSKTDSYKRLHPEKDHGDLLASCPEDEALTPGDECMDGILDESLLETCPIQSPLQVFAGMGGLALIAERLPMLYPEVIQQVSAPVVTSTTQEKPKDSDQFEWVTIEQSGELVYEAPETIAAEPPPIKSAVQTMSPIPAHSLAAFGLFLRLPGYAEVLLKERKHAQCLLRLVLGVTDDGEGSHILQSPSANVLPTLPFHVLRSLFSTTPLTTDDGVLLRRMALEIGALHLILVCLSALSHHAPRVPNSSVNQTEPQVSSSHNPTSTEEQQLYWAKGTGFGTGSTASGWDVEQALTKQRLEEEHVTCLLQVLASYINPVSSAVNGEAQSSHETRGQNSNALPSVLLELLSQSCLIPAMSSYLRNDSVLDMARHVPLYRALLELLRAIASCTAMVPLLLPLSTENGEEEEEQSECQTSVGTLLAKMKTCVDTYTNRLRSKRENVKTGVKPDASDQEPEGLTLLVPDIQKTAEIVYAATTSLRQANQEKKLGEYSKKAAMKPKPLSVLKSLEEKYVAVMKKLQFDTFEMVSEDEDGKLGFKVNYHYMSQVKNANDANSAARARRLAQEAVTLSTSLPLSSSSSVFVRCDEERLDIMKVLITGPADTPYANGCFEFDVYFPQDYPSSPPLVNLETTGGHSVRFNPNLYNDGKVCLSILNTWHGRPEEKWNPQTSSFLQVLVSVQSLILVAEPYFNEPGYERSRGTPSGTQSSREYDGNIRQATVKWAMLEQIRNPSPCFKEVIHKHFYLKRVEIMAQCEEWIADIQQYSSDKRVGRTMSHHAAALKRHTAQLREELLKLPCPEGLDPDTDDAPEVCRATAVAEETLMHDQVKPSSSKELPSDFQL